MILPETSFLTSALWFPSLPRFLPLETALSVSAYVLWNSWSCKYSVNFHPALDKKGWQRRRNQFVASSQWKTCKYLYKLICRNINVLYQEVWWFSYTKCLKVRTTMALFFFWRSVSDLRLLLCCIVLETWVLLGPSVVKGNCAGLIPAQISSCL